MAIDFSKLLKKKQGAPAPTPSLGLPAGAAAPQDGVPPNAPGLTAPPPPSMGALMAPTAPTRKAKPKRGGKKGY